MLAPLHFAGEGLASRSRGVGLHGAGESYRVMGRHQKCCYLNTTNSNSQACPQSVIIDTRLSWNLLTSPADISTTLIVQTRKLRRFPGKSLTAKKPKGAINPGLWPLNPREPAPELAQALGSNPDEPLPGFRMLSSLPFCLSFIICKVGTRSASLAKLM